MKWAKWVGVGVALMFLVAGCASTPQGGGERVLLGEHTVNHLIDHDEVVVTNRGEFRRISLRVKDAPVEFFKVEVHYANGAVQNVDIQQNVAAGGESRSIDLEGEKRVIERVVFRYRTDELLGKRATVQLWGIR